MLKKTTISFLKDLGKNNNREWFMINKEKYESSKADFDQFIGRLIPQLAKVNPALSGLEVKDCIFRIYKDVRFSKDKTPYKTSFSAQFKEGGKKSGKCGFYLQVDPIGEWGSFMAGGFWMPEAPVLRKLRQEVEYNTSDFKKIINSSAFKKYYGALEEHKLKKAPKGVDPMHPDIELLKYTSYVATHQMKITEFTTDSLIKECVAGYKVILPFLTFLNKAND
jgi:hypothetical protein